MPHRVRCFFLILFAALFAAIVAFLTYLSLTTQQRRPDPVCTANPILELRLGDRLFQVSRNYRPNIYGENIPKDSLGRICQRPDEPAIEAKSIEINLGSATVVQDEFSQPISSVQLRLRANSVQSVGAQYVIAKRWLESKGVELETLPEKHGFLAFDGPGVGNFYYFARPETISTPAGFPFTVMCSGSTRILQNGEYLGHFCSANYQYLPGMTLHYRFYDGRYPIENWPELDAAVRAFVKHLEVE